MSAILEKNKSSFENKKTQDKETETERSAIIYGLKEEDNKNDDNII